MTKWKCANYRNCKTILQEPYEWLYCPVCRAKLQSTIDFLLGIEMLKKEVEKELLGKGLREAIRRLAATTKIIDELEKINERDTSLESLSAQQDFHEIAEITKRLRVAVAGKPETEENSKNDDT